MNWVHEGVDGLGLRPLFSVKETFSVRAREKTMETVD